MLGLAGTCGSLWGLAFIVLRSRRRFVQELTTGGHVRDLRAVSPTSAELRRPFVSASRQLQRLLDGLPQVICAPVGRAALHVAIHRRRRVSRR